MAFTVDYIQNGENNEAVVFNRPLQQLANAIDSEVATAVPTGVITMWSGSIASIPNAWALCDGANGTPDLRNRFVVGAGGTYAVGDIGGSANAVVVSHSHSASSGSAGSHSHTASTGNGGYHGHSASTNTTGAHTHSYSRVNLSSGRADTTASSDQHRNLGYESVGTSSAGNHAHTVSVAGNGTHSHSVSVNSAGSHSHTVSVSSTGESGTNKNLPPYYALAYIMKT